MEIYPEAHTYTPYVATARLFGKMRAMDGL
jgi:hypothetical protein